MSWHRWVGDNGIIISVERFGASAPMKEIYRNFGLTTEAVVEAARRLLAG